MDFEIRFVVCIDNAGYPASLELHKIYRALSDDVASAEGDIRVIDDSGEDYVYPASRFMDVTLPTTIQEAILSVA